MGHKVYINKAFFNLSNKSFAKSRVQVEINLQDSFYGCVPLFIAGQSANSKWKLALPLFEMIYRTLFKQHFLRTRKLTEFHN